ncbi:integrase catalytic domain-containing protein [Trichonephila clavipes]|nr:integrase catalytic domain-containing protein [Trichonephila clavipes]
MNQKNGGKFHYLPHRPVFKENSTTKIRPVFDGSAHHGKSCSLNDCVEKGPNLIEMIPAILNRFRLGKIGVISDIRKAFLQISLHENDMNFLRFLWWEGGNLEKAVICRHRRVGFGVSCSPFLLAAVLNHHFKQAPEHLEKAAEKLKDSMYVDNCVTSVDSSEELESFKRDSTELLSLGKFDLRGWRHSDIESNFDFQDNQQKSDPEEIIVLRLMWNVKEDTFSISYRETESKEGVTKRRILSLAHRIFDPIGFTCPITLIPKLLIQECWKIEASWDSKLPIDMERKFETWKKLIEIQDLKVPRRLSNLDLKDTNLSLQVFCDASKLSYATCAFLRAEREGEVTCQLIQARSKVAPLKGTSIPRLELLACMIGARLADSLKKDLHMEKVDVTNWSDSMDALHWLKRDGSWATFVANRVEEIRRLSSKENWRYVSGMQNPADLPSRGCSVKTLKKVRWWEGPSWLKNSTEDWPKSELFPDMEVINSEKKKTIITAAATQREEKYYLQFSSYVVKALIIYTHVQLGHAGVQMLMNTLRESYWILKGRKTIKEVIQTCIICKRFNAKPISVSEYLLPQDRVRDAAVFEIIGFDLAGPLILKNGEKNLILILTFAVYRGIHLELLTSISTESFLLGLRRFIVRRGRPSVIYSDNGTNFKGAYRLYHKVNLEKLKNVEELNPISWKFIPPQAPWWGGFWERFIGLVKRTLRKTLGKTSLNHEEVYTVLCHSESLINSRPLTYVTDETSKIRNL